MLTIVNVDVDYKWFKLKISVNINTLWVKSPANPEVSEKVYNLLKNFLKNWRHLKVLPSCDNQESSIDVVSSYKLTMF